MYHVRGVCQVDFDGAKLFPDLSRHTLMQRRALKPLLEDLQDAHLTYRWGFPFSLSVTKDGRHVTLRNKMDLPQFLSHLGLPSIDIPDWRTSPEIPVPARSQPWQPVGRRGQNRPRNGSTRLDGLPPSSLVVP